jgi:hypothetical protein
MPQETLELGTLLVSEIADHGSEDTLAIWMTHYIAELIAEARREGTTEAARAAQKEACKTILKLWEHRSELAGRANPMKEYETALQLLHQLSRNGYFVFGREDTSSDPIERFRQRSATLLSSLLVLILPTSDGKSDVATRNLSKIERKLMHELHVIKVRRIAIGDEAETDEDPRETLKRDILDDVARVRTSLDEIESMLAKK